MQLPPSDELVLIAGLAPIRAKKARYFADRQLAARVLPPPERKPGRRPASLPVDDWSGLKPIAAPAPLPIAAPPAEPAPKPTETGDPANAGIRREPELPEHEAIAPKRPAVKPSREFDDGDEADGGLDAVKSRVLQDRAARSLARQVSQDPADGMEL